MPQIRVYNPNDANLYLVFYNQDGLVGLPASPRADFVVADEADWTDYALLMQPGAGGWWVADMPNWRQAGTIDPVAAIQTDDTPLATDSLVSFSRQPRSIEWEGSGRLEKECLRGDTFSWPIPGLGPLGDREKLWFTVKKRPGVEADNEAIIQITEAAGLLYLNGEAAETPGDGSLTVT